MNNPLFIVAVVPSPIQLRQGEMIQATTIQAKSPLSAEGRAVIAFEDAFPEIELDNCTILVSDPYETAESGFPAQGEWSTEFMLKRDWCTETNRPIPRNIADLEEGTATITEQVNGLRQKFDQQSEALRNAIMVMTGKLEATDEAIANGVLMITEGSGDDFEVFTALSKSPAVSKMYPELVLEAIDYVKTKWSAPLKGSAPNKWLGLIGGFDAWKTAHDKKGTTPEKAALRDKPVTSAFVPTQLDKDTLALRVMLLVMGISPEIARASDVKNARELIEMKDASYLAWLKTFEKVPGIYGVAAGDLYVAMCKRMAPAHLIDDEPARDRLIAEAFPHLVTVQDSAPADQGSGAEEETNAGGQGATEEREGPFYFFNRAENKIGRANKIAGLEKALAAGAEEISKEEHAARKAGTFIEPEWVEESEESGSEVVGDAGEGVITGSNEPGNDSPEPQAEAPQETVKIEKVADGMFSIEGLLGGSSPSGTTPSNEVEKTENAAPAEEPTTEAVEPEASREEPKVSQPEPETTVSEPVAEEVEPEDAPPAPAPHFEPGRYPDIPNDVYHASNGISSTMIKDARVSLMYFNARHVEKVIVREKSKVLDMGNLIHTAILEPEKLELEYSVEPVIPQGAFVKTVDYKKFIERHNATIPEGVSVDELKEMIAAHNASLPQPFSLGGDILETTESYQALPEEFQRIGADQKHTAAQLKACIKEFNATLPSQLKTTGSREALIDTIATFNPEFVEELRSAPERLSASGTKADMAAAIRSVKPDAVFYDEIMAEWNRNPENKILVTREQLRLAMDMQKAVYSHPEAGHVMQHQDREVEASYYDIDPETGLELRVRPDLVIPCMGARLGFDLKSISMFDVKENQLKERIRSEIIKRDYHLSAAMYCDVAQLDQFFWVFVNKDEHYHWVVVVEATAELLELGREELRYSLNKIAHGYDFGEWPAPIVEDYQQGLTDFDKKRLAYLRSL